MMFLLIKIHYLPAVISMENYEEYKNDYSKYICTPLIQIRKSYIWLEKLTFKSHTALNDTH